MKCIVRHHLIKLANQHFVSTFWTQKFKFMRHDRKLSLFLSPPTHTARESLLAGYGLVPHHLSLIRSSVFCTVIFIFYVLSTCGFLLVPFVSFFSSLGFTVFNRVDLLSRHCSVVNLHYTRFLVYAPLHYNCFVYLVLP